MSIRWDSLLVRHVARSLDERLSGHHLRGIRLDGEARDLVLFFRERSVIWRLHPTRSALLVRPAVTPAETDRRIRARLRRVDAPPDDRIVRFEMMGRGRHAGPLELFVEVIGNRLNAVVTGGEQRTIRHVLVRREGERTLSVGAQYRLPESTGREGADETLPLARWLAILAPVPPPDRGRELVRRIAWSSPLNRTTFLEPDLESGHAAWRRMVEDDGRGEPAVLVSEKGRQPYPFPLLGYHADPADSLLDALEACVDEEERAAATPSALALPPALLERLEDAVHRQERRLAGLQAEMEAREDPEALRRLGDLILARFSELPADSGTVRLTGFDGRPVEMELDPTLAPQENAARYYDRAARSERAAKRLPRLLARAEEARDTLAALLSRALAGDADPAEVRNALPAVAREAGNDDGGASLPYRTFRSSGGLEIRVGRGAKHNDDLTFHHSAPDDVWLHARHTAGAHVILRWRSDDNPPARDLAQAAVLAALHSKARTSTSVPVDWTRRKYVRKPRGSAPGTVTPDRVQTLFVRPEETLLEELSDDR